MSRGGLEMAMPHVIAARPEDLHGSFDGAREFGCFHRVVDPKPAPESASDESYIYLNPFQRHFEKFRHFFLKPIRRLCRRPDRAMVFSHIGDAVHRLHWRVRVEGIEISRV